MTIILDHLVSLYGTDVGNATFMRLSAIVDNYSRRIKRTDIPAGVGRLGPGDAILITYGDQVQSPHALPLQTLAEFCERHLIGLVSGIHVLPFYPYSSDDGFAVIDYRAVNPALGSWADIDRLSQRFDLMFDAVINHISAESRWFAQFLRDDPRCREFFLVVPDGTDLSKVVRPRALPLLTRFHTLSGDKNVWTTFSADQIDLNYRNPDVLVEIIDTLLYYVEHGAKFVRLDAIAFLWKEPGTSCINLPEAHRIVQLLRAIMDQVAPYVILITETNVPHADNLSYLGDGSNEAQMVYNFALPPLVLHSFHAGNAQVLSRWARDLALPSNQVTFFNFLASHDGIGLNPARGLLSDAEIDALVLGASEHGGLVSYKDSPDGNITPYELNINYLDALSSPKSGESMQMRVARFIAAQAIMLSLVGVPGIYFHSLFGSRGWSQGVAETGQKRTVNREKCNLTSLERELAEPTSRRHAVFDRYSQLLRARADHAAFHPLGRMRVLDAGAPIFAVLRTAPDDAESVLCLHNVSGYLQSIPQQVLRALGLPSASVMNLVTNEVIDPAPARLDPYQVLWVKPRTP